MLRGLVICPDSELAERLEQALSEAGQIVLVRDLDRYPTELEFMRFARAHAPQVVFLSTESLPKATEIIRLVDREFPGLQLVAVHRSTDAEVLLDIMRAGVREFCPCRLRIKPFTTPWLESRRWRRSVRRR